MLDKPYRDGGVEHSGRIAQPGDPLYYDVVKQHTAVKVIQGQLNDNNKGALWSVEMALAFDDVLDRYGDDKAPPLKPSAGSFWRINFSRVELKGKINWTWQPQLIWDPVKSEHCGKIDMHLPDAWGYLWFAKDSTDVPPRDLSWPARLAAMNLYYGLHHYQESHGSYTDDTTLLSLDNDIVQPFEIVLDVSTDSFVATVLDTVNGFLVRVRNDRLLEVEPLSRTESE
jgi:hypothetical protein